MYKTNTIFMLLAVMISAYARPHNNATPNADGAGSIPAKMCSCNNGVINELNDELSPTQKFYLQKIVKKWVRKVRKRGLL